MYVFVVYHVRKYEHMLQETLLTGLHSMPPKWYGSISLYLNMSVATCAIKLYCTRSCDWRRTISNPVKHLDICSCAVQQQIASDDTCAPLPTFAILNWHGSVSRTVCHWVCWPRSVNTIMQVGLAPSNIIHEMITFFEPLHLCNFSILIVEIHTSRVNT